MLTKLFISNYAIIDYLEIDFCQGFNTISGETGAGKSIILGALNLLLGHKFESQNFKNKASKVIVEAEFESSNLNIKSFFRDYDLDYSSRILIRREFIFEGKSRAFINDTPVKLSVLKDLSVFLVDIHSQHQNLLINSLDFQINLLDHFSSSLYPAFSSLLIDYKKEFVKYQDLEHQLHSKKKKINNDYNCEYYQKIIHDFEVLNLDSLDKEQLESQYKKLTNIHEIKSTLTQVLHVLEDSDNAVLNQLNTINSKLSTIAEYDSNLSSVFNRLKENTIDISDLVMDLQSFNHELNLDALKLEMVENRLNSINELEKKLQVNNFSDLVSKINSIKLELDNILNISSDIKKLKLDIENIESNLFEAAEKITYYRKKSALKLSDSIQKDLNNLGVNDPNVAFKFTQTKKILFNGLDQVVLYFSANSGYDMQPVVNIGSGGEIARLMLCVKKYLFQTTSFSTIIFDEIDAGVSGLIARKMGRILQDISQFGQVICITHSPQIASLGDSHYKVLKNQVADSVHSDIIKLTGHDRVEELARMLSGDELNKEAIANAKKMLDI